MQLKLFLLLTFCGGVVVCNDVFLQGSNLFHVEIQKALENKNLNTTCMEHLEIFLADLLEMKMWALNMSDASSKIPSGIFAGNIADLGSFDQCLSIEHKIDPDHLIDGKFCQVSIPLKAIMPLGQNLFMKKSAILPEFDQYFPKTRGVINLSSGNPTLTLSMCIPSTCSAEELNGILEEIPLVKGISMSVHTCQTKNDPNNMNAGDWVVACFFVLIIIALALSTAYDIYLEYYEQEPFHLILVAFSLYTNGKKLLATNKSPSQLPCLNGIRFISMMWVIMGHTYFTGFYAPSVNSLEVLNWMKTLHSMYIIGATISVDSFFVLGGLVMSYTYLLANEKGAKFNVPMYYLHRYIRLTPALAMMMLLHMTILRFSGSGPYWPTLMSSLEDNCSKYWWSVLLYVQNYVNPDQLCMGQTWYLSVDMQLFILSPLVLIPLAKWPRRTLYGLSGLFVVSIICPFTVAYIDELNGLIPLARKNPQFNSNYYVNTYTRFGPWVVGIIAGYFVYNRKENTKINKMFKTQWKNLLGWALSLTVLLLVIYGPNTMYYHDYNRAESSIFLALHRVAWGIALSWIIYACIMGYGGAINWFLSLSLFQILARLTYSMYLIHLSMQFMRIGQMRTAKHFSDMQCLFDFWGDFWFTLLLAVCWSLAFESPMIIIEKIIFGAGKKNAGMTPILPRTKD